MPDEIYHPRVTLKLPYIGRPLVRSSHVTSVGGSWSYISDKKQKEMK